MPNTRKRTAAMSVTIGEEVIAKLTTFGNSINVTEEMVSGADDTTSTDNAVKGVYIPVQVDETANCGGVCIYGDTGEAAIITAARNATEGVVVAHRWEDGSGTDYTGFFTNYEVTAELPNVARFTAQFRVNSITAVPPAS